jgi:hypothetical protein
MTGDRRDNPPVEPEPWGDDPAAAASHPLELALRYGLRYSGLRDVTLDARLLLYVPLDLCEREMVLPLGASDESLELATAFPDPDLTLVQTRFPALAIELVFAPVERIAELLDDLKAVR